MENNNQYNIPDEMEEPKEMKLIKLVMVIGGLLVLATLYFTIRH